MMVEAGPKKRTKIIIAARRGIRSMKRQGSEALLSAIQQRATNAIFGFDKYPQVRERRAQMGFPQR
jgi:hypothetical protein